MSGISKLKEKVDASIFKKAEVKIKKDLGKKLSAWLNKEVTANNKNIYYDLVIAKYLKEANLFVKYINNLKWWEIDDESDLKYAQKLFK